MGSDPAAETMAERFLEKGLDSVGLVRSKNRRTTVKTRVISGHQHVVRVDEEDTHALSPEDEAGLLKRLNETIAYRKPAAILIEDYNKGVLTPNTIQAIIHAAKAAGIPVSVDPKTENFLAYRGVDLFKPNLKELREGLKVDVKADEPATVREAVSKLEAELHNAATMVTLSEHGVYAHDASGEHFLPAHHRKIADVSGAGDTVIAVATLALAQGLPIAHIAELANLAGGLVCEEVGVVPIDPVRFREEAIRLDLLK
jgi:rfaE bifunctional protein kinase chain/domain